MRYLIFLSLSIILFPIFLSCSSEAPYAVTAEDFDELLEKSVVESFLPIDKIELIDPYESYFIALKAADYGYYETAVLLARHSWKNSGGFIGEKAAELSIKLHMEQGDYAGAEFLSSLASADFPEQYKFYRLVVESKYWQKKDLSVIESLKEIQKFQEAQDDGELKLFKAVSSLRLKSDNWKKEWKTFFLKVPASNYIRRGWDYLTAVSNYNFSDFGSEEELFRAKYSHSVGDYSEAADYYRAYLATKEPQPISMILIQDIENLYIGRGSKVEGAQLLEEYGDNSADSLAAAGRLYRRAGLYSEAQRCMDRVIELKAEKITDRDLWYSLDIAIRRNITGALDSLDYYIERWEDPLYFVDTLDNLCTVLAGRRRWSDITRLALKLESAGPAEIYDRCRYISERAAELGWTKDADFTSDYSELYYRIITGESLGELQNLSDIQQLASDCTDVPYLKSEVERYINGLLEWNVGDPLEQIRLYRKDLSEAFLAHAASETVKRDNYLDSIRIMYQFEGSYSLTGYKALYPDIYRSEIEKVSFLNDIPPQLMFALVWKESGFEKEIVSRSGAIGLSQLMPATAEDVARRQRKTVGDLTNPVENLELGAWYLNWLNGYVGNTATAVLSYNGGPGRVKSWERRWPSLPDDLFYEVIPIVETHLYGKKVLEAAVLYGLIYYGIEPMQTLQIFFQEKT